MNEHNTPQDRSTALPELSDAAVDRMEQAVFARIAEERGTQQRKRHRRTTIGWVSAAAAIVVVGAAAIGPSLVGGQNDGVMTAMDQPAVMEMDGSGAYGRDGGATDSSAGGTDMATEDMSGAKSGGPITEPQVITTVQTSLEVTDVTAAVASIATYAEDSGGFVESQTVGQSPDYYYSEDQTKSVPATPTSAYIVIRIPSDSVGAAETEIAKLGTVSSTSSNRTDVTTTMVDLDARIDSLEGSITRLNELRDQATSIGDMIEAESAITDRQGELDSLTQQRTYLADQVSMSTVSVSLTAKSTVAANPAGFTDGIVNGWNGLVATLNGMIIGLGFLLPWLVIVGVVALVVWLIIRSRRKRTPREAA